MPNLQPIIDVITKFAQDVLVVAAPIAALFIIRWLKAKGDELIAEIKRQPNGAYLLEIGAAIAVQAAEQLKLSEQIQDKKTFAVNFLTQYLETRGVHLSVSEISAAIEAAVYTELTSKAE